MVSVLGIQHENLYEQKDDSSSWTVTELEVWESSQKKYGKLYAASRFQVGRKLPGYPSVAHLNYYKALQYSTTKFLLNVIYLHFSIISPKHLLAFPCSFIQSFYFMFYIFHKFFITSPTFSF